MARHELQIHELPGFLAIETSEAKALTIIGCTERTVETDRALEQVSAIKKRHRRGSRPVQKIVTPQYQQKTMPTSRDVMGETSLRIDIHTSATSGTNPCIRYHL